MKSDQGASGASMLPSTIGSPPQQRYNVRHKKSASAPDEGANRIPRRARALSVDAGVTTNSPGRDANATVRGNLLYPAFRAAGASTVATPGSRARRPRDRR
jgi:hypothetical protein